VAASPAGGDAPPGQPGVQPRTASYQAARTEPGDQPSCPAASASVRPSRQQSTTGSRSASGRRAIFLVQEPEQFADGQHVQRVRSRVGRSETRDGVDRGARTLASAGLARHAQGDAVQPAGQRLRSAEGARPAGEDEEGSLEAIFCVVDAAQDMAADAQHHAPVAAHQSGEGCLVALAGKALQQRGIRRRVRGLAETSDVAGDGAARRSAVA